MLTVAYKRVQDVVQSARISKFEVAEMYSTFRKALVGEDRRSVERVRIGVVGWTFGWAA